MKKLIFLIMAVFMLNFISASLNDNLVAYYNFTNGLETVNGGGYNLTNNVSSTNYSNAGVKGTAGYYNGSSTALLPFVINNSLNLGYFYMNNTATTSVTVNFWMQKISGGVGWVLISTGEDASSWQITYDTSNHIAINTLVAGGLEGVATLTTGRWYMVTMTRNDSKTCIYVNGTIDACGDKVVISGSSTRPVEFLNCYSGTCSGKGYIDELGFWNRTLSSTEINQLYNNGAYLPSGNVSVNYPSNNSVITNYVAPFNCSAQMVDFLGSKIINMSLYINGVYNYTKINSPSSTFEELNKSITFGTGAYNWSCIAIDNSNNQYNSSIYFFNISNFVENSQIYNSSTYETSNENLKINISYDNSFYTSISANLIYNGTSYTGTKTGTGQNITFDKSIIIPLVTSLTNNTFYWVFSLTNSSGTTKFNSTFNNQTVNPITFGICNSSLTTKYLNITFADEGNYSKINNVSISYSLFYYWISDATVNKSLTFINSTENPEYSFCFSPNYSVNVDYYLQYKSAGLNYPQRTSTENLILTNTTTNITYYLIQQSNGLYVTFQVTNLAKQAISGVSVIGTRLISGVNTIIASGTTDNAGSVTFFLDPNFQQIFNFTKSGYTTFTFATAPTQSAYTIILSQGSGTTVDYRQGISHVINPSNDYLTNDTIYDFNYSLSSTYWNIDSFGFYLYYSNGSLIGSNSTSSNGGLLTFDANTGNSSSISMIDYYYVNGTQVNGTRYWTIQSSSYGNDFSLLHFFTDFTLYSNSGFFGLGDFGKALISVVLLVLVAGTLSYRYGLASEPAIMGIVFGLVLFLDSQGWIPNPNFMGIAPVKNFVTIITFIVMLGMILREEMR
jgi:hypothetical protein